MNITKGTVVIDLTLDQDTLWNKVHKDNRWSVNKARKLGVAIKKGGDRDSCYQIYQRLCEKKILNSLQREKLYQVGKLFTAVYDGKVVAFAIMREDVGANTVVLRHNATDYGYKQTQANSLLYWDLIRYYQKRQKFRTLDLGGIDLHATETKGIDSFKMKWGGSVIRKKTKRCRF